jgi:hypothetical protein
VVTIWSRRGNPKAAHFPEIVRALTELSRKLKATDSCIANATRPIRVEEMILFRDVLKVLTSVTLGRLYGLLPRLNRQNGGLNGGQLPRAAIREPSRESTYAEVYPLLFLRARRAAPTGPIQLT